MNTGDLTPRRCYWETVCNTQEEQRQRFRKDYISHWGWLPSPFKSEIGDSKTHSLSPRHPPVRTGERITSNACAFTAVRIQALVLPTWPSICLWLRGGMIAETNRDHYSSKQQDTTFLAQHPLQRLQRFLFLSRRNCKATILVIETIRINSSHSWSAINNYVIWMADTQDIPTPVNSKCNQLAQLSAAYTSIC